MSRRTSSKSRSLSSGRHGLNYSEAARRGFRFARKTNNRVIAALLSILIALALVAAFVYLETDYLDSLKPGNSGGNSSGKGKGGAGEVSSEGNYYHEGYEGLVEDAKRVLPTVLVHDENSSNGYGRDEEYGYPDFDFDNSGCNTREDIRMIYFETYTADKCKVETGVLAYDPYTGEADVKWKRSDASTLQVEHVVALEDADRTGADLWGSGSSEVSNYLNSQAKSSGVSSDPDQRKRELASDPLNLILVNGAENGSKGSKPADQWLVPNNPGYRCEYVARQVMVKDKYGLYMTTAEADVIKETLDACTS